MLRICLGLAIAFEHLLLIGRDPVWRLVAEGRSGFGSFQVAGVPFLRGVRFSGGGTATMFAAVAVVETIWDLGGAEPMR